METNRVALIRYKAPNGAECVGSGLLIDDRTVLTADHVACGTKYRVYCTGEAHGVSAILRSETSAVDLAVLALDGPVAGFGPLGFARINQNRIGRVDECVAVGFPRWKKDGTQRRSAQVDGIIPTAEGLEATADCSLRQGFLTLVGNRMPGAPQIPVGSVTEELRASPWGGMSGAAVVSRNQVVGVVRSHNLAAGGQSLTVTPITAIDQLPAEKRRRFWAALGVAEPAAIRELQPVGGLITQVSPEEFKADVLSMLSKLDSATRRGRMPVYLPASADVTRMARIGRMVGRVRQIRADFETQRTSNQMSARRGSDSGLQRAYALPAERDMRADQPPRPWEELSAEYDRLVVLADPGMGKSWLVRTETHRLALAAAQSLADPTVKVNDVVIPIPIRADVLAGSLGQTLAEAVTGSLVADGFIKPGSAKNLQEQITGGGVVLLIDALDEVPREVPTPSAQASGKRLEDLLRDWAEQCSGTARCVLTSRLAGYTGPPLPGVREVELLPFAPGDVGATIDAWDLSPATATRVERLLRDRALAGIARNPLLLALICSLAAELPHQQPLPATRTDLYQTVMWRFLSGAHRSADRGSTAQTLTPDERQKLLRALSEVAISFADTSRGWIDRMPYPELLDAIHGAGDALADHGGSAAAVLAWLVDQAGILVPLGNPAAREQAYVFLHRTFAEYLVARRLSELPRSQRMRIVEDHQWFDSDWAEVIPMLCGLLASEHLVEAQALVEHLLAQRFDPLHRALHTALRGLGECPDPDALLTQPRMQDLRVRIASLLASDSSVRWPLLKILESTPRWPRAVTDALLAASEDERIGARIRRELTNALTEKQGPETTESLLAKLHHPSGHERVVAVGALAGCDDPGVTEALVSALEDEYSIFREKVIEELKGRDGAGVAEGLLGRLNDDIPVVRVKAAEALAGRDDPGVTEALVAALSGKLWRRSSWDLVGTALRAVAMALPVSAQLDWLEDKDSNIRRAAAEALIFPPGVGRPFARLPAFALRVVQDAVVKQLGRTPEPEVTEALLARLTDPDLGVQAAVIKTLGRAPGREVTEALLARLPDQNPELRRAVIAALAHRPETRVTKALVAQLEDTDVAVRGQVLHALSARNDRDVTEALLTHLAQGDPAMPPTVIEALAENPEPKVTEVLAAALQNENLPDIIEMDIISALAKRPGPFVTELLLDSLRRPIQLRGSDWHTRRLWECTIRALAARPEPQVTQALLAQLGDANSWGREEVIEALAERPGPKVTEALIAQLEDNDMSVRKRALVALGYREDPGVTKVLLAHLGDERYEREGAIIALDRGGYDSVMAELLVELRYKEIPDLIEAITGNKDPLILAWVCKPNFHGLRQIRSGNRSRQDKIRFDLASWIIDRAYPMLPPQARPQIRRRLGKLTRRVSSCR